MYRFDNTCGFNDVFYESMQWAVNNGTTMKQIEVNLKNNIFVLTGALNDILSVSFEEAGKKADEIDLDKVFKTFETLGHRIG